MSNKTQKAAAKKTAWARRYSWYLLTLFGVFVFVLALINLNQSSDKQASTPQLAGYCLERNNECRIRLEAALTPEEHTKGLSGRSSLGSDDGMIFVFEKAEKQCFWMKDMQLAIDIIFLDSEKNITRIYENVSPNSYPETFCAYDVKYVLETSSGSAGRIGLGLGQKLSF